MVLASDLLLALDLVFVNCEMGPVTISIGATVDAEATLIVAFVLVPARETGLPFVRDFSDTGTAGPTGPECKKNG